MKSFVYVALVLLAVTAASGRPGPDDSSEEVEDNELSISPPVPPNEFWQRLRSTLRAAMSLMTEMNKIPEQAVPFIYSRQKMRMIEQAIIHAYQGPGNTAYQRLSKAARILELKAQLLRTKATMFLPHHDTDEDLEEALRLLRGELMKDEEGSGEAENRVGDN